MLLKTRRACFSLLALLLFAPSAEAQFHDHHPPYVDPHFDLHHTPLYDYGARATYGDHGAHAANGIATCEVCSGNGNHSNGSRSPKCPAITNAILTLWVQDELQVAVNGYPTKQQNLGGIHKNSRIFSLEGLETDRVSPCDITIILHNRYGSVIEHSRSISVRAGEHYEVRYPDGFATVPTSLELPVSEDVPPVTMQQSSGGLLPPQTMQNAPLIPQSSGEVLPPDAIHETPPTPNGAGEFLPPGLTENQH